MSKPQLTSYLPSAVAPGSVLAVSVVLNGIVHPLLAWRSGGYFSGLFTAPLGGGLLLRELVRVTAPGKEA